MYGAEPLPTTPVLASFSSTTMTTCAGGGMGGAAAAGAGGAQRACCEQRDEADPGRHAPKCTSRPRDTRVSPRFDIEAAHRSTMASWVSTSTRLPARQI
jgi:hypothetical protein